MYTQEVCDYDWDGRDMVHILDPDGDIICTVCACEAKGLLSHLNKNN